MDKRNHLIDKLIKEGAFWSYDKNVAWVSISDEQIIEHTLIKLDIDDINILFQIYPKKKIQKVWREKLVIQNDYYYSLNRFFAWYYFKIKKPDSYIKSTITRHISKLSQ